MKHKDPKRGRITDKQRLDWLEKEQRIELYSVGAYFRKSDFLLRSHNKHTWFKSCREAIDSAMKAERNNP